MKTNVSDVIIENAQGEFVTEYLRPFLKNRSKYERMYLSDTISRTLIAKRLAVIA